MAEVDTVTISADGSWTPAPSGSDTRLIIATINQKHVYLRPPASSTNGRRLEIWLRSPVGDSHVSVDLAGFAPIDRAVKFFPAVCSFNPIVIKAGYSTDYGKWLIDGVETMRDPGAHKVLHTNQNYLRILSNSNFEDSLGGTDTTQILADLNGTGVAAYAYGSNGSSASIKLNFENLQAYAAMMFSDIVVDPGDGNSSVIQLYAKLRNESMITPTGGNWTLTVSANGGATSTTAAIANAANTAAIVAALEALPNVGANNVKVREVSAKKQIIFAPHLGQVDITAATGATIGDDLGEQLVYAQSSASGVTTDITNDLWWLVPVPELDWPPSTRFSITYRVAFSGADYADAYIGIVGRCGTWETYAPTSSSSTAPTSGYAYRQFFYGSAPHTWTVPDQDQFPDIPRRGDGTLYYVNQGTADLTLQRSGVNFFLVNGTRSTTITLAPGDAVALVPDGKDYTVYNMGFTATDRTTLSGIDATVNHATYGNAKLVRATTPANTLDVSAAGNAGIDWANIDAPTTAQTFSGSIVGTVTTLTNKTGFSLTQSFPSNFASLSIDGSGRIDVGKMLGSAVTLDANNALNVSAKYMGGTLLTPRDIGTSVLLSSGAGTGQVLLSSGHISNVDTLTTYTGNTPQTGDAFARLGAPSGASISADIATRLASGSYTAPPSASTIASQIFGTSVDGVVYSTMLTNFNAALKGDQTPVSNGDGTYTITFKKEDGTTTAFTKIYNPSTGVRT